MCVCQISWNRIGRGFKGNNVFSGRWKTSEGYVSRLLLLAAAVVGVVVLVVRQRLLHLVMVLLLLVVVLLLLLDEGGWRRGIVLVREWGGRGE